MRYPHKNTGSLILLLLVTLLLPLVSFKPDPNRYAVKPNPIKWVLAKACSLKVNGSTNINKFICIIPQYPSPDTLSFSKSDNTAAVKISGAMVLDVANFDCHNPMMTADLRKTLKSKAFPKIIISFMSLSRYPDAGNAAITGVVSIQLAGVTKQFEVDYRFSKHNDGTLSLVGTKQINFSDFNISPPRKLGGMIKTNNELSVEFILKARVLK